MSWPLFLVEVTTERYERPNGVSGNFYVDKETGFKYSWDELGIGACWFADEHWGAKLSQKYHTQHEAKRKPLWVKLPTSCFCVDSVATNGGDGWDVTGDPPKITVSPSINIVGRYHGYIQGGIITDDCEGRTFHDKDTM